MIRTSALKLGKPAVSGLWVGGVPPERGLQIMPSTIVAGVGNGRKSRISPVQFRCFDS